MVPDHTACGELWRERGELIQPVKSYKPEFTVLEMCEVSAEGVAQALNNLYYNPDRRQKLAQAAFAASQDPRYSWDAIIEKFDNLFVGLSE